MLSSSFMELLMANRPRDLADRIAHRRDRDEMVLRETFRLPLADARLKAREIIDQFPEGGYMTTVEHWRQLPNGQIEFTLCRLRTVE
jgi:hypothetical protein